MSLLIDQYGRPIILFDPSITKDRLKDKEAYKVIIQKIFYLYFFSLVKHFSGMWCQQIPSFINGA
jgi:hypothetical protein